MKIAILAGTLVLSTMLTSVASAQYIELGGFGGALRMGNDGDIGSVDIANPSDPASRVYLTNKYVWGARMGLNIGERLGFDIITYAYQRTAVKVGPTGTSQGFAIHTVAPMVLYHFTSVDSRIRPFVQGGGGFASFCPPGRFDF